MANDYPVVILAAGASKRLGRPKAFVEVVGKTLLLHAIERFQKLNCQPIVVVTNQDCLFQATLESKGATVVLNSNPEEGRTGSIQLGLSTIMNDIGRLPKKMIISPVDRPGWKVENLPPLLESQTSSSLFSNGIKGHPVSIVGKDLHLLLGAEKSKPLRDIIKFDKIAVDAPLLSLNIDTPKDLETLHDNKKFFETD